MSEIRTITVEALGHTWTFSPNDMAAEFARTDLVQTAREYILSLEKPATRIAAHNILIKYVYYKDIMSAVSALDGDNQHDLLFQLANEPAKWLELCSPIWQNAKNPEIVALWLAACEVNPHWYPLEDIEEAPEEVEVAHQQLEKIETTLTDEEADYPETEDALEAAGVIMQHQEERAKKKAGSARRRS